MLPFTLDFRCSRVMRNDEIIIIVHRQQNAFISSKLKIHGYFYR